MSNYYAQLDSNDIVFAITELHSEETYDHLIAIDSFDLTLLGKQYDAVNKVFTQTLDQVKTSKMQELDQAYQFAFMTFQSLATGVTKTYPINQEAQDDLKDLQQRLIADPNKNSFYFLTIEDGILINHTRSQFLQLLDDAESKKVSIHNQNRTYANKISTTSDIPTLQAMTFTFS